MQLFCMQWLVFGHKHEDSSMAQLNTEAHLTFTNRDFRSLTLCNVPQYAIIKMSHWHVSGSGELKAWEKAQQLGAPITLRGPAFESQDPHPAELNHLFL